MGIEEYFGKDSRPLNDIKESLLEYGDESLLKYNVIRKIVIVDIKCAGNGYWFEYEGEDCDIDLVLILKTGELRFKNVNRTKSWGDYSNEPINYISIATNQVTKVEDIVGIKFESAGCLWEINDLEVRVATVSGARNPLIIGRKLNEPTDELKTLNNSHTLINSCGNQSIYFDKCNPNFECVPTIPSSPKPLKREHDLNIDSEYNLTIKWKKPDFDGYLKILRYEVWSSRKNVWMDAGLKKDKGTYTYTINYDEDNDPICDKFRGFCDTIKIRAVNTKGPGLKLAYYPQV